MPGDLTLTDMIEIYKLPPNVDAGRFREIAGIGNTRFYELAKEGVIRLRKNGSRTTVPVEDLYKFLRGDQAAA
ncbi:DNA-binding protein [Bradyrhizobium sp. LCT2]|uniref:DNA-binding protein n=1 Tax=Bradyrhizobium sp. LCT2 TaxID=2493093 RepID=UPI001373C04E|nr:DNA-binding protein [Bradyrhizobium sp. LCT2]QHP69566.1 DNA-binding protein [Bradyrhizobium sp. LCT2]